MHDLLLLFCLTSLLSQAEAPPAAASLPSVPAATVETADDLSFVIGKQLRCPVCQGMPIAESPATMAQDMMKLVRQMVQEGKSQQEILDYFVQRYGEWVLLKPKAEGFNLLVWILPPVGLLAGLYMLLRQVRRLGHGPQPPPPVAADATPPVAPAPQAADAYLDAVRREVER